MKKQFNYYLEPKCGQYRSGIRLHSMCSRDCDLHCPQKLLVSSTFWEGLTLSQTSPGFYMSAVQVFLNTVGKGEIPRDEQFPLFPQCFLSILRTFCHFHQI